MTDASAAPPRAFATATIRWAHGCRVPTSAAPNVSRTVILRFSTRRRGRSVNLVSATNRASVRVSFMRLRREYTGVGGDVKLAPRCAQSSRKGTYEPRALLLYGDRAGASHSRARGVRHRSRSGAPGADRAGQPEGERDRHAHRRTCPRREAREKDGALARGAATGHLFGLPVAHKDLVPTRGIRTTYGSRIYRDHVPDQDALLVERLRGAGAITFGKTNTPEFGAGSQTFNEVFGRTLNPYDLAKTCGGSSGGAAVALACGMVPIADGSDTGGSLRNPASFCNVLGLRGAVGRVPPWPTDAPWGTLHVPGAMARTVADLALMLSVMAGPDRRSPIAIAEPGDRFRGDLGRDFKGVRIAWSRDLGGLPVDRRVTKVLDGQRPTFEALGCHVEDGEPDFTDARHVFQVQRALSFSARYGPLLAEHRHQMKDTVIWNTEEGLRLTAREIGEAEVQ